MLSEEVAKDVCKNIIDYNQHGGKDKPNNALVNIAANGPGRIGYQKRSDQNPPKQPKLIF